MSTEAGGPAWLREGLGPPLLQRLGQPTLASPQSGGFYSAEDADSPPERGMRPKEGAFYLWTVKEVQQLLREHVPGATEPLTSGQLLMKHYGLTEAGNISPSQVRPAGGRGRAPEARGPPGRSQTRAVFFRTPRGSCRARTC